MARDVVAAFDAHVAVHGASVTAQCGYGLHLIVGVGREWIEEGGDLHDLKNPHNVLLATQAARWADSWAGSGSVYAVRLDLDETGGGNVDLFVAPIRIDGRNGKPTVSGSKPLTELRLHRKARKSYQAIQDDWAEHCCKYLDPAIQRGVSKTKTNLKHLEVEEFRAVKKALHLSAHAEAIRELENDAKKLKELVQKARSLVLDAEQRAELSELSNTADEIVSRWGR